MKVIAFDTETRGLNWWEPDERAFLASWADRDGEYVADLSDPDQVQRFENALHSADTLVCHNLAFDAHQVRATLGLDVLGNGWDLHDTDLMSRVLFPEGQRKGERGGHGLKNLAKVFLSADATESEDKMKELAESAGIKLKAKGGYYDTWRAYPDEVEHYARMDARFTYDLFDKFNRQDADARAIYELERSVAPILIRAEERGIAIDQPIVQELIREYTQEAEQLYDQLVDVFGEQALGGRGSEEALLEALQEIGVPLYRKTQTGKIAVHKFALQEFEDDFPVLKVLADYRQAQKFLSTYLSALDGRGVVHTSFGQIEAWTGRMSSRRPNMQNIPVRSDRGKKVRSVFVPREGHSFVVCDYDSIEIRLLAWYLGDEGFRQLIEDGHDPHSWMAAQIHGGTPEDFAKGGPRDHDRSEAKNTLFAITYGAGAPRVADMNKISKDQAKGLISKIKSSLPRYHRLNSRIRKKVAASGHVTTLMGRKQPIKRDKAYVGLNALIQGSAADIMKQGLVNVHEAVSDLGGVPLLVVHDEVVVEVPTEHADECLRRTESALCSAYELSPSLEVSGCVVDTNYADAK